MTTLTGRVAILTGAGQGIGRSEAFLFAAQGARVVVNDFTLGSRGLADDVVDEITANGGEAFADHSDVSDFGAMHNLVDKTVDTFGGLDIIVNNAGILRDRMIANMTEDEWDLVIAVHLKGAFNLTHHAAAYWRGRTKAGQLNRGRIINTTSASGIYGNAGQANYGAAKAGVAAMTIIVAEELSRYGVTANAIAPFALTQMSEGLRLRTEQEKLRMSPDNVAPIVAWLASEDSAGTTGRVFNINGHTLSIAEGWVAGPELIGSDRWTHDALSLAVPDLLSRARGRSDLLGRTVSD